MFEEPRGAVAKIGGGDGGKSTAQGMPDDDEPVVWVLGGCFLDIWNDHVADRFPLLPEALVDVAFFAEACVRSPHFDILDPIGERLGPAESKDDEMVGIINGYVA